MTDELVRATAGGVRLYAVDSSGLTEEACARHNCWALASAALGRVMTGALLLSATFKENERITVRLAGDGPLGAVVADAGQMTVRGYVNNPAAELPMKDNKLDVGGGIGKGQITVTRFSGLKTPVSGSAELISGEVAEDLTNYLYVSEQTPACVSLGVLVGRDGKIIKAVGFFVQAMPDADIDLVAALEGRINALPPVTVMLEAGLEPGAIIRKICGRIIEPVIHDRNRVAFRCGCSRESAGKMLKTISGQDAEDLSLDEETEVCCHFCNAKYLFDKKEIGALVKRAKP